MFYFFMNTCLELNLLAGWYLSTSIYDPLKAQCVRFCKFSKPMNTQVLLLSLFIIIIIMHSLSISQVG